MISIAGLANTMMNYLGVPLGARVKSMKSGNTGDGWGKDSIKKLGLIRTILEITVDDVCVGAEPFFYKTQYDLTFKEKFKFDKILTELNKISKWIAYDLLADGYSVYKPKIIGNRVYFMPVIKNLKFVLTPTRDVVVYDEKDNRIADALIFINYNKTSLSQRFTDDGREKEGEFDITPIAIQLNNIQEDAWNLANAENSVNRYRRQLSKILRFVTVEVGVNKGDQNQDIIDDISSGINADSESLEGTTSNVFDDQIPVFPTRKGLGKPEITESVPSANISDLKDIDNLMSKIFLGTRFPKTYADFSSSLDSNTVSLIRGDIRYSRMLTACRTLIEKTVNDYFANLSLVKRSKLVLKLQTLPSPEDTDTIDSMRGNCDFLEDANSYVFDGSESYEEAMYRLESFVIMLGSSASMKSVEEWVALTKSFIREKFSKGANGSDEKSEEEFKGSDLDDIDIYSDESGVEKENPLEDFEPEDEEKSEESTEMTGEYLPNEIPSYPPEGE